jgi:hypothetical protein
VAYVHKKWHVLFLVTTVCMEIYAMDDAERSCWDRCKKRFLQKVVRKEVVIPLAYGSTLAGVGAALNKDVHESAVLALIGFGYARLGVPIIFGENKQIHEATKTSDE